MGLEETWEKSLEVLAAIDVTEGFNSAIKRAVCHNRY